MQKLISIVEILCKNGYTILTQKISVNIFNSDLNLIITSYIFIIHSEAHCIKYTDCDCANKVLSLNVHIYVGVYTQNL